MITKFTIEGSEFIGELDAMDADFEKVYEKFMGGLKNEHGYYPQFTNDIVNTTDLGRYEEMFILQNLVGRW